MDCTSIECMTQVLELPNWPKKCAASEHRWNKILGSPNDSLNSFFFSAILLTCVG